MPLSPDRSAQLVGQGDMAVLVSSMWWAELPLVCSTPARRHGHGGKVVIADARARSVDVEPA
ncbi:MAG: hypothetical protein ACP5VR_02660 [Acidimicrobiales bacterium]